MEDKLLGEVMMLKLKTIHEGCLRTKDQIKYFSYFYRMKTNAAMVQCFLCFCFYPGVSDHKVYILCVQEKKKLQWQKDDNNLFWCLFTDFFI